VAAWCGVTEQQIAETLVSARRAGRGLTELPGEMPVDMTSAYRIQDAAIAQWPDTLVGWKIGFIPPDRRSEGEPDRLVGPVWASQCHQIGNASEATEMPVFVDGFAAVEAEIVVRLEEDPAARRAGGWTAADAAAVAQRLLVGIEVASSPIPEINALGPAVIAADFGNNNGLVLGPELPVGTDPASVALHCFVDGVLIGEGSGANLPGGLHHGLATAWNLLDDRNHSIRAGMVFATGATTGIHLIGAGQHCRVEAVGVGTVEVQTTAAGE
jgi:2-keto-4-pentenoate hydratase